MSIITDKVNSKVVDLRILIWVFGCIFAIFMALTGAIYASIDKRIDSKADKDIIVETQKEVHWLLLMHLREGYKIPEEAKR